MATYGYGSTGDGVKDLQEKLNAAGYDLATDGIFGEKTLAAVKDYQASQGLTVDGLAGTNTLGSLSGGSGQKQQNVYIGGSGGSYGSSSGGAGKYTSKWQDQVNELYEEISKRDPFSYDPSKDQIYNTYRDLYLRQGRGAMRDATAQASALTGGYGSTYAENAGQQAYFDYVSQLNGMIPALADSAYQRWLGEGDELMRRYEIAAEQDAQAFARYQAALEATQAEEQQPKIIYKKEKELVSGGGGGGSGASKYITNPVSSDGSAVFIGDAGGGKYSKNDGSWVSTPTVEKGLATGKYVATNDSNGNTSIVKNIWDRNS